MTEKRPDEYIMIQPVTTVKWVAQRGLMSEKSHPDAADALPEETYDTLEEAISKNRENANQLEHGIQVTDETINEYQKTKYDENTLVKVYSAMQKLKVSRELAMDIVNGILNEGIVFREREDG